MKKIILFIICILLNSIILAQNYGNWTEIDSLNIDRTGHAMVLLPNGNVLASGNDVDSIQSSCEIYEISTGKWRYTTPMNVPRTRHKMVTLSSNNILTIGGLFERSCEIFDPQTETWTMTDSMPSSRNWGGFTTTTLLDNRILVIGGLTQDSIGAPFIFLDNCEIYNPLNEKWIEVAPLHLGRKDHTATLLKDGRVLVTGGTTENLQTDECEIYDPSNNTWIVSAPMLERRWDQSAILLNNGNVFVSGGNPIFPWLKSCEVYDINTNQWFSAADMLAYRTGHRIYYLSKIDKLLILGGDAQPVTTEDTWEIYDPVSLVPLYKESFPVNQSLVGNNVQLLNGNILIAGKEEYVIPPGGLPYSWPSKRSWIFDVVTNVAEDNNHHIEDFRLEQNYPNPFNPTTTISYSIKKNGLTSLKVFDILGNEVATLVHKNETAGNYSVEFNAEQLPSGIYIYRLTSGNFTAYKKLILMK